MVTAEQFLETVSDEMRDMIRAYYLTQLCTGIMKLYSGERSEYVGDGTVKTEQPAKKPAELSESASKPKQSKTSICKSIVQEFGFDVHYQAARKVIIERFGIDVADSIYEHDLNNAKYLIRRNLKACKSQCK